MKILHIIDSDGLYGAEIMLLNLMHEQKRPGIEPILLSMGIAGSGINQLEEEAGRKGLTVIPYRMNRGYSVRAALDILKISNIHGADVIHSHGYKSTILIGSLPRFLRTAPFVRTLHGWTSTKRQLSRIGIYEYLDKAMMQRTDALVHVNTIYNVVNNGSSRSRHFSVENGIPTIAFEPQEALKKDPILEVMKSNNVLIGAISRLSDEKGLIYLIEAVSILKVHGEHVNAVIIGEGPQRPQLEKKVKDAGLEKAVTFLGYRPRAYDYLPAVDIFVLPSLTEGLPIVILEAMQSGTPIVATAVGGVPNVLGHGQFGRLVNPGDPQELADAISNAISNRNEAAAKAGLAQKEALTRYSSRRMAVEYQKVYETVLHDWKAVAAS